jgi:hypothetical protein
MTTQSWPWSCVGRLPIAVSALRRCAVAPLRRCAAAPLCRCAVVPVKGWPSSQAVDILHMLPAYVTTLKTKFALAASAMAEHRNLAVRLVILDVQDL